MAGADVREAKVWMTVPPQADPEGVADLSGLKVDAITDADVADFKAGIERIQSRRVKARVSEMMQPLMAVSEAAGVGVIVGRLCVAGPGQRRGRSLRRSSMARGSRSFSSGCSAGRAGAMARWRRASRGARSARSSAAIVVTVFDRLKEDACPASKTVPPKVMKEFSSAADAARGG